MQRAKFGHVLSVAANALALASVHAIAGKAAFLLVVLCVALSMALRALGDARSALHAGYDRMRATLGGPMTAYLLVFISLLAATALVALGLPLAIVATIVALFFGVGLATRLGRRDRGGYADRQPSTMR